MDPIQNITDPQIIQQIALIVNEPHEKDSVLRLRDLLQEATGQSREKSAGIADAIANSAHLIEELETTKLELSLLRERFNRVRSEKKKAEQTQSNSTNRSNQQDGPGHVTRDVILGRVFQSTSQCCCLLYTSHAADE